MSAPDADLTDHPMAAFTLAASQSGLSVAMTDAGTAIVTCEEPADDSTISFTEVCALAGSHGHTVVRGHADFDAERIEVVVAPEGWTRGDGEGGGE